MSSKALKNRKRNEETVRQQKQWPDTSFFEALYRKLIIFWRILWCELEDLLECEEEPPPQSLWVHSGCINLNKIKSWFKLLDYINLSLVPKSVCNGKVTTQMFEKSTTHLGPLHPDKCMYDPHMPAGEKQASLKSMLELIAVRGSTEGPGLRQDQCLLCGWAANCAWINSN